MKLKDECLKPLLFRNELEDSDFQKYKGDIYNNSIFFYYKNLCYNTDDVKGTSSDDYDGSIQNGDKCLLIKYFDNDKISVVELGK